MSPGIPSSAGLPGPIRTVFFWLFMVALAAMLWKLASGGRSEAPAASPMSYSEFMENVDRNNIKSARLLESPATAEIQGQCRDVARGFSVTVPKEVIPELTEKLRKQGAVIEVSEVTGRDSRKGSWGQLILNFLPILVIVALWIFMVIWQQMKRSQSQAVQPPNRPLG